MSARMPMDRRDALRRATRGTLGASATFGASGLLGTLGLAACGTAAAPATRSVTEDYSSALRSALEPFTDRLPGYHVRATPLGNFGVGSVYLGQVSGNDLSRAEGGWFLGDPSSWLAPELSAAARRDWLARLVAEGSLGPLRIDASRRRMVETSLGVAVFLAIGASASLDFDSGTQVTFQSSEIRNRRLDWAQFVRALDAGLVARPVAEAVQRNDFVMAAADLVLVDYRAEVVVDETMNPRLATGLRGQTRQLVAKGVAAGGSMSLRESSRGRFVASSDAPVVAAVLLKRPPPRAKGGPPTAGDPANWPAADTSGALVDAVDQRVLQGRQGGR